MVLMRRAIATSLVLCGLVAPGLASADPTKEQCVESNEKAQALRASAKLKAARAGLVTCLATSCPGPVRQDCADRIAEIDRVMPTIVFDVKDPTGQDATGVALRVDGAELTPALDGTAIPLDPGTHKVTFVPASGPELSESLVVHEGEKARRVAVNLLAPPASGLFGSQETQRRVAYITAGAGLASVIVGAALGGVAKSTYDSAISSDCGGSASHCTAAGISQISSAHGQATGSTVAFILGGLLVGGGAALWLTARENVTVAPSASGATLVMGGSF
jgi:hypothetical protein